MTQRISLPKPREVSVGAQWVFFLCFKLPAGAMVVLTSQLSVPQLNVSGTNHNEVPKVCHTNGQGMYSHNQIDMHDYYLTE